MSVRHLRQQQQMGIERELMKEQSGALGRAGAALAAAIARYHENPNAREEQREQLLDEIADRCWQLQMQREFTGFVDGNREYIQRHYAPPAEAMARMGKPRG
ncbi:hypothetical protein [Ferrimonas marina]|uniref:Uncharacterized protein n=1 Tax=Ferrimonas marina TaxID=299255 RepID=A0A1M5NZ71_9GAMM|nr:hypothetical protein [Ferrimonas marina]SHG94767.1 hypothetical protein SAMN02745129_1230 [Ferrimonas marina]